MKKTFAGISLLAVVIIAGAFLSARGKTLPQPERAVSIQGEKFTLEVADNDATRIKGLSGRENLAPDRGMLFIFDKPGKYPFWMKDTEIPLDIIWIKGDEVQEVVTLYPPRGLGLTQRHDPLFDADKVIELNAGVAARLDIRPGTKLGQGI
ncbi:MAG: DUF192 domain-containing protein [Patescibacteria group bacterium]